MPNHKTKILIVEDEPIIAMDIKTYLKKLDYLIIGIAYNSEQALDMIFSRKPELVLLDISIEGTKDGIEIADIIKENYDIPFLYLTSHSDEDTLSRATATNPYGYIVKPFDEQDLKASIAVALHNYRSKKESKLLTIEQLNKYSNIPLSEKELLILTELTEGKSSNEIATCQKISYNTVKFHLKNIYLKMDVSSKSELLAKILH